MKLKEISQISIRVEEDTPTATTSSFLFRVSKKVKQLVLKYFPKNETPEIQFKTTLAILLSQDSIRSYLLEEVKRREDFFAALTDAARECGFKAFSLPQSSNPQVICQELTRLLGQKVSLVDDPSELAFHYASLNPSKQQAILFSIFDRLERPPIHSVVEIEGKDTTQSIPLTTQYAQYKILGGKPGLGNFSYSYSANHATCAIRTPHNSLPDSVGTVNQKVVRSTDTGAWIGSYCGELSTPFHVMEQILLIAGATQGHAAILEQAPLNTSIQDLSIVFTSLFSWYELSLITDQKSAIHLWDQKILLCDQKAYRLNLFYYNIPLNHSNRLPTPAEIKATLKDINDEAWIPFMAASFRYLNIHHEPLIEIATRTASLRTISDKHFLEREKALLEEIDRFRELLPQLLLILKNCPNSSFCTALLTIHDKKLNGIEKLICLDSVIKEMGFLHNKNSRSGTDRVAGALAADKAQYAFQMIENKPFLPFSNAPEEKEIFKSLYSNYLLKEEPEVNAALSSGFRKPVQRNAETRYYL